MNFENMTDAELDSMIASKKKTTSSPAITTDYSNVSDSELDAMIANKQSANSEPGLLSQAGSAVMSGLSAVGNAVDSVSGAPTRSAIQAGMNGENPLSAFAGQFGGDPSLAPTGKEIATNAGLSTREGSIKRPQYMIDADARQFKKPGETFEQAQARFSGDTKVFSPAGVAGLGIDLIADPLNFIPVVGAAKGLTKAGTGAAKATAKYMFKGSAAAIEGAKETSKLARAADTIGNYASSVTKNVKSKFNPTQASDIKNFAEIAKRNNINPKVLDLETIEFGPHSSITKKSQVLAEGPGGEAIQKRYMEAQGEIEDAFERNISSFSGGKSMSPAETGQFMTDSYNKTFKNFFDQDFTTHQKIANENPGMILNRNSTDVLNNKILKMEEEAGSNIKIGSQRDEGNGLLRDIESIKNIVNPDGSIDFAKANRLKKNIGEEAFKKYPAGTKIPTDQKALQEFYHLLNEQMIESVAWSKGEDVANQLISSNVVMSDFLSDSGQFKKIFSGDLSREEVFGKLAKLNLDDMETLRNMLPAEDFQKLKGAYVNSLVARNKDGVPLWGQTMKKVGTKRDNLVLMLSEDEVNNLDDLLKMGDRIGDYTFNTSRTNTASKFGKDWLIEVAQGGADEVVLDNLKQRARSSSKSKPAEAIFKSGESSAKPKQAQSIIKNIPLLSSTSRQAVKGGEVASIQERNKEIERRKRAISGSK